MDLSRHLGKSGLNSPPFRLLKHFLAEAAQIGQPTPPTFGRARLAGVATVQDQPVMCVQAEGLWHTLFQLFLDLFRRLAFGQPGAIANPQDMRVDGKGLLLEPAVEHDIGGLAAHSRQPDQILARVGNFTTVLVDQQLAQCDHILRLGVEKTNGFDVFDQPVEPQIEHLLRGFDFGE